MTTTLRENAETSVSRVAIGVFYLFLDRAIANFPTTTRSHPSIWVVVERASKAPVRSGDTVFFPFKVRGLEWQDCVVPVLSNDTLKLKVHEEVKISLRVEANVLLVRQEKWDEMLGKIKDALIRSYQAAGYLPVEDTVFPTDDETGAVEPPGGTGEPINRTPWILPEEKYTRFDC